MEKPSNLHGEVFEGIAAKEAEKKKQKNRKGWEVKRHANCMHIGIKPHKHFLFLL